MMETIENNTDDEVNNNRMLPDSDEIGCDVIKIYKRYIEDYCVEVRDYELQWVSDTCKIDSVKIPCNIEHNHTNNGDSTQVKCNGILHTLYYTPKYKTNDHVSMTINSDEKNRNTYIAPTII